MPNFSKKHNQRHHAKKRAEERYDVTLNRDQYRDIVSQIREGKAEFLGRESANLTHWTVTYEGKTMRAVYDSKRDTISTFLPEDATTAKLHDNPPKWYRIATHAGPSYTGSADEQVEVEP